MDSPERLDPADVPRTIALELTSRCNMHCVFCPSDLLRREAETADDGRVRTFLEDLRRLGVRSPVLLNVLGEPLLNKRVFEYLDLLERNGHPMTLITNMTRLGEASVRRELLRHDQLTLALSLQTATPDAYKMRGYPQMPFEEFFGLIGEVVEDKFRTRSRARLEIHVASNYVVGHDPSIEADSPLDLWPNFPDARSERRWIRRTLRGLDALSRRMRRRHREAYESERERTAGLYRDHIGTRIAASRGQLPADFHHLKDDVFWGYMFAPNVFLVFKSFELWTRDPVFLRGVFPPDKEFFVEDHSGPWACPMTESFGLLADGSYILCCLDYEGEMGLGGIDRAPASEVLRSAQRRAIRADAMTQAVCRRCKGRLFVFDTAPLPGPRQEVNRFGRGYWPFEPGHFGRGVRWTGEEAWAYLLARIPARALVVRFHSGPVEARAARLEILRFRPDDRTFEPAAGFEFPVPGNAPGDFRAPFAFEPGRLYLIVLKTPVFVPDAVVGNGDPRRLGLGVFEIAAER